MKKALLALLFLGCGTLFAETHFSVGIGIGGYGPVYDYAPPPPPEYYEQTPCPGDGYSWVDGYWSPSGGRFFWRQGYWRAPAYFGYRGGRGYARGYAGGNGWHGGYEHYDRHDRDRREWGRDEHRGRERNEYRHEERRDRHEERRDHDEGNGWRR